MGALCCLSQPHVQVSYMKGSASYTLLWVIPPFSSILTCSHLFSLNECSFLVLKVQQSLEKIAKLEQEKEHWMLEAQLAKIRLEKENKKVANKLKNSGNGQLIETSMESSLLLNAPEQEKEVATEKALREPVKCMSLVSLAFSFLKFDELENLLGDYAVEGKKEETAL